MGEIYSKEINIKYHVKNIQIDIYDEINVSFEIDNTDYHDLITYNENPGKIDEYILEKMSEPSEFRDIIINCNFNEYHVTLINFIETEIYYKTIETPQISGKCSYCKLIKNNKSFNHNDNIKIWDIYGEIRHLDNFFCLDFKNSYLKDKILLSKNRNCSKINEKLNKKIDYMFEQLTPFNWFIYQENNYENYLKTHTKFIDNIHMLLSYYTSNIEHERISIIESVNKKKLEILFKSKNSYKLNGHSCFHWHPNTFIEFLDSSYEKYHDLKESEFNIDLLIQYYIWFKNEIYLDVKHLLGSIFLEVLIKQYYKEKDSDGFANKLKNTLELKLKLNTSKLFDNFEIELFQKLNYIKTTYMDELKDYDRNINNVITNFKKNLFIEILTTYRNKNVHSGEIRLEIKDIKEIFKNSYEKIEPSLNGDKNKKILNILKDNKNQILDSKSIIDLKTQNLALEKLIEIILLKLLNIDCTLLLHDSKTKSINSKKYINSFTK